MSISYFNKERYADPTAYEALKRIEKEAAEGRSESRAEKYRRKRDQEEGYPLNRWHQPETPEFLQEELCNAIIFQAVCDWRDARAKLIMNPEDRKAAKEMLDAEKFFLSEWFGKLTNLIGFELLERLIKEG